MVIETPSSLVNSFTGDHKLNNFKHKQQQRTARLKLSDYLLAGSDPTPQDHGKAAL